MTEDVAAVQLRLLDLILGAEDHALLGIEGPPE